MFELTDYQLLNQIYLIMDSGIITGIVTAAILILIMAWLYSIGKNYESKKKKIR
jgi:hypothetical protein